jgi:hypothetical protein
MKTVGNDRKTVSTISIIIFFLEMKLKTISEILENRKQNTTDENMSVQIENTETLYYKNIYLTLYNYVICINKFKLYYIKYKLTSF